MFEAIIMKRVFVERENKGLEEDEVYKETRQKYLHSPPKVVQNCVLQMFPIGLREVW